MANLIEEVRKDLSELEILEKQATRQKIKNLLSIEIHRLVSEIVKLEEKQMKVKNIVSTSAGNGNNKCYQVKLNNYAWDQSEKYLKLYVTLPKVQSLAAENVFCNWTKKTIELQVKGLENKDYLFTVNNLLHAINTEQSSWKIKSDMIVILAAKEIQQNWSHVTEYEKKASDSKKLMPDKPDKNTAEADPSESLMSMMKKMYEQGDDDMKRIIAKAWTEGQEKKQMEM